MRRIKQIWIQCCFVVLRLPSGPEVVKNELPENESPEGDVRVSPTGNMLNLRRKKRKEIRGTNGHPHLWERTDDLFQQPFRIFAGADPDCITAKFSDNVLKPSFPNRQALETRRCISTPPETGTVGSGALWFLSSGGGMHCRRRIVFWILSDVVLPKK
jgi:hypothetical protein